MSDYRAIQGVSSTLKKLLETFMVLNGPDVAPDDRVAITLGLPDQENAEKRVNLFLYHIIENAHLKNQDLPGAAHPSEYGRPPLALQLHYLVTAYSGDEEGDQLEAQQILGDAMRVLHDHPYLAGSALDPSLEDAVERVRLTLEPLTVEDVTKVFVSLTTPYRLSVGYKVTAIRIQSRVQRSIAGLIGDGPGAGANIVVLPIKRPRIDEILVIRQGDPTQKERTAYARIGDRLVIKGQNLDGAAKLLVNGAEIATPIQKPDRMEAVLPDIPELQPGPTSVRVVADLMLGTPPVPHRGASSNLSAMMLIPRVTALNLVPPVNPGDPPTLDLTGTRLFLAGKECLTLVGDRPVGSDLYTTSTATNIVLPVPAGLPAGAYPVRVRVNGADSIEAHNVGL